MRNEYVNHIKPVPTLSRTFSSLKKQAFCPKKQLVGGFNPIEKYYIVKMGIFPQVVMKRKKIETNT